MVKKIVFSCLAVIGLVYFMGCSSGSSSSSPVAASSVDMEEVAAVYDDLDTANLSSASLSSDGKIKRWPVETSLIPVKLNDSPEATYAVDLIEATLGMTIFDRESIADTPDDEIVEGMIVSMGTAVNAEGEMDPNVCGSACGVPGAGPFPPNMLNSDGAMGGKWYINIGSDVCDEDSYDVLACHEFAHALGLLGHFEGFGIHGIIGENFWNALKTLYFNPIGASGSEVNVYIGIVEGDGTSGTSAPGPDTDLLQQEAMIVLENLITTNLRTLQDNDGKLKRWPVETSLIPVKTNESPEVNSAMDLIETTLGMTIFDRTSIADTPDDEISEGLIISMGTAVSENNEVTTSSCLLISSMPGLYGLDTDSIRVDQDNNLSLKVYLNIGSSLCNANLDELVIFSLGWGMGMLNAFDGFGINAIISADFWNVLKTLYANPINASIDELTLYTEVVPGDPNSGLPYAGVIDYDDSGLPAGFATVLENLVDSNLNIPQDNDGKLKRWPVETSLIPVKTNDSSEAIYAMDLIEATLGMTIFDRISIADTPDDAITRGLIVSMGTAVSENNEVDGYTCIALTSVPGQYEGGYGWLDIDSNNNLSMKVYLNIGSSECIFDLNETAIFEFGHCMGVLNTFPGFGEEALIRTEFWNVLKTLYANPINSTADEITVYTDVVPGDPNSGVPY